MELAERKAMDILQQSKENASHIIEAANQRAEVILAEAKEAARVEGQNIIAQDTIS